MILKNNAILSSLPLFFHDSPQLSVISDFSGHPTGSPLYISLLSNQFLRCLGVNRFEDGRFSGKINDSERIRSMFVPGIWLWFKVTTETKKVTERKRNNRLATNVNGYRREKRKQKKKTKKEKKTQGGGYRGAYQTSFQITRSDPPRNTPLPSLLRLIGSRL